MPAGPRPDRTAMSPGLPALALAGRGRHRPPRAATALPRAWSSLHRPRLRPAPPCRSPAGLNPRRERGRPSPHRVPLVVHRGTEGEWTARPSPVAASAFARRRPRCGARVEAEPGGAPCPPRSPGGPGRSRTATAQRTGPRRGTVPRPGV